ncbi:hypothetical protein PV327_008411 [Microctonus hyperodae]|uniref:Uncharacterized protein n=1 Tax=Microctonus hyperodae TaxID=165561 RepID=A0AA39F341_MICHY|nr:hypothetical protein PV327_008411 [Microctonus hyperodae]
MFSELCRETLRKAAVCYSAGRTGSPSPSPPTSPPSSPAKETKIVTNIELANVNCANDQVRELSSSSIRAKSQYANQGTITSSTDSREITNKKSNSTDNMEKRTSMFTDFTRKWRRERRRAKNNASDPEIRECRSSSCERVHSNTNYYYQNKTNNNIEYYHQRRECKRYRRDSSGSSTDPDDSSTSGDEVGSLNKVEQ